MSVGSACLLLAGLGRKVAGELFRWIRDRCPCSNYQLAIFRSGHLMIDTKLV